MIDDDELWPPPGPCADCGRRGELLDDTVDPWRWYCFECGMRRTAADAEETEQ